MKQVYVSTQRELDALPETFQEYTMIYIEETKERIFVTKNRENSSVVAWGNSSVEARGNSSVVARENSSVVAWENSSVVALGNSSVVALGNSSVEARGNSSVEARGNSSVEARGNSSVVARENSSVVAWENSSVVALGNSSVEARGNSSVVAWGKSSVEAWGNSSVEAWGNVGVHLLSDYATVTLFIFSVCWELAKGKIIKKSKTATIIKPEFKKGLEAWFDREGIEDSKKVILFKKTSHDLKTQENTKNETLWEIGKTIEHHAWSPENKECGEGKFHACSRAYFCDEFRNAKGDRYIAIEIKKEDLFVWDNNPNYPHKIAFRKGKVLYECNKLGKKIC